MWFEKIISKIKHELYINWVRYNPSNNNNKLANHLLSQSISVPDTAASSFMCFLKFPGFIGEGGLEMSLLYSALSIQILHPHLPDTTIQSSELCFNDKN